MSTVYSTATIVYGDSVCKEEGKQHHTAPNNIFNFYSKDAIMSPLNYFMTTQSGGYECNNYINTVYHLHANIGGNFIMLKVPYRGKFSLVQIFIINFFML